MIKSLIVQIRLSINKYQNTDEIMAAYRSKNTEEGFKFFHSDFMISPGAYFKYK